ncbi:MAG: hypothetical protein M3179_07000 [Actinomycetota bacterium]|nr:hypothetical protein [Actinomycetota bacterium]
MVLEGEQSALDVVGAALARDWIDEPAVARRAELAARAPSGHGWEPATPLSATELRELLERHHAISETLRMAVIRLDDESERLARATNRHGELSEQLAWAEARQNEAQQVIDAFDHPLRRRLHRPELDQAKLALRQAHFAIDGLTRDLAEIEGRLPALRSSLAQAQETLRERPVLEREHHDVRQRLGQDLDVRKIRVGADPPDHVVDLLGRRPTSGSGVELWDEAAARINQHRVAFDVSDYGPTLGSPMPVWERSAFATSQREAVNACDRLDRGLGRGRELEPPGLDAGDRLLRSATRFRECAEDSSAERYVNRGRCAACRRALGPHRTQGPAAMSAAQ